MSVTETGAVRVPGVFSENEARNTPYAPHLLSQGHLLCQDDLMGSKYAGAVRSSTPSTVNGP